MRIYELRQRKHEINEITQAWSVLSILHICSVFMHDLTIHRKDLHYRSHKLLVRLTTIMRSIGKFLTIKSRIRTKQSSTIINRFYGSIKMWITKRKEHHLMVILEVVENSAASNFMFRLMARWYTKIVFIQRKLRLSLLHIKMRNGIMKLNWNRVEIMLFNKAIKKRKTISSIKSYNPGLIQGNSSIPDFVKEYYIRNKLKQRVRDYIRELYYHKIQCQAILKNYTNYLRDRDNYPTQLNYKLPEKPVKRYYITQDEYKYMIMDALKNRLKWEHNPSAFMK